MQREPGMADQPSLDRRGLVGGVVVHDHVHVEAVGHALVDQVQEATELLGAVPGVMSAMTLPEATSNAAYRLVVPLRL